MPKILLFRTADDLTARLMSELSSAGYDVVAPESTDVRTVIQHQPDLILLDVHLPDINGAEVLARLKAKARTRDIPVVVLSADATKSQISRLMSLGAEDYLTKPLDVDCFLKVIEEHFCEPASTNGNGA